MRKNIVCLVSAMVIVCFCAVLVIEQVRKPVNPIRLVTSLTRTIRCEEQITFECFAENNFTCTGMTYDEVDDVFWIADYGKMNKDDVLNPRIVELSRDLKSVKSVIDIKALVKDNDFNLQGVSFDNKNNSLWIATGDDIFEIDKKGVVLNQIRLGKYAKYKSNGIAVDGDNIWVLCYEKYLLKYTRSGELLKKYVFNYADQDQICINNGLIYCTVGADYQGKNNYVFIFNPETEEIENKYIIEDSYSVEGITIVNDEMFITNDGAYHSDALGVSYISKYLIVSAQ